MTTFEWSLEQCGLVVFVNMKLIFNELKILHEKGSRILVYLISSITYLKETKLSG